MELPLAEWFTWVASNPARFASLHWLCSFSIASSSLCILAIMLATFAYSGKVHKVFKTGLGGYYIRGMLFFALLYSCAALVIGIRFHAMFAAVGKATWMDVVLPKKGASLIDLIGHCTFYYTAMLLTEHNGFLVLLNVVINCAVQIWGKNILLCIGFIITAVFTTIEGIKEKNRKTFGKWLWAILLGFNITTAAYGLKIFRMVTTQ